MANIDQREADIEKITQLVDKLNRDEKIEILHMLLGSEELDQSKIKEKPAGIQIAFKHLPTLLIGDIRKFVELADKAHLDEMKKKCGLDCPGPN